MTIRITFPDLPDCLIEVDTPEEAVNLVHLWLKRKNPLPVEDPMKWNIDQALHRLTQSFSADPRGTQVVRVPMELSVFKNHGLTPKQQESDPALVWCIAVGGNYFYGLTIHEANLKAQKGAKKHVRAVEKKRLASRKAEARKAAELAIASLPAESEVVSNEIDSEKK